MPAPVDYYEVIYSEGNELDVVQVNDKSSQGWELVQIIAVKPPTGQAKFAYVMKRRVT